MNLFQVFSLPSILGLLLGGMFLGRAHSAPVAASKTSTREISRAPVKECDFLGCDLVDKISVAFDYEMTPRFSGTIPNTLEYVNNSNICAQSESGTPTFEATLEFEMDEMQNLCKVKTDYGSDGDTAVVIGGRYKRAPKVSKAPIERSANHISNLLNSAPANSELLKAIDESVSKANATKTTAGKGNLEEEVSRTVYKLSNSTYVSVGYGKSGSPIRKCEMTKEVLANGSTWKIEVANSRGDVIENKVINYTGRKLKLKGCYKEGTYTVRVEKQHFNLKCCKLFADKKEFKMTINDILVVGMGDSYSSGEGAPNKIQEDRYPNYPLCNSGIKRMHWADDGTSGQERGKIVTEWVTDRTPPRQVTECRECPEPSPECDVPLSDSYSLEYLENRAFHRSIHAPSSIFAMKLEESNRHTSVTYVNLAMSGASFGEGWTTPKLKPLSGYSKQYHLPNCNGANQHALGCATQIGKLKHLAKDRTVDAIVVSIGGNDAGFGNLLEALIVRENHNLAGLMLKIPIDDIRRRVYDGAWDDLENEISSVIQPEVSWAPKIGLSNVPLHFQKFKNEHLSGVNVQQVFVMEYPNGAKNCNKVLDGTKKKTIDLEIGGGDTPGEIAFVDEISKAINQSIKTATLQNGWTYVDGIYEGMKNKGLCKSGPNKWFVELKDYDSRVESNYNATLRGLCNTCAAHPNSAGYSFMATKLWEKYSSFAGQLAAE